MDQKASERSGKGWIKEKSKEQWIGSTEGTMGHIAMEGAMGQGASFGSGSNRMIDGYYKRSRKGNGSGNK